MQCQFCGFDNSEVGLREGRCNQCGSMLHWKDSTDDVAPEVQAAVAKLAARIAPLDGANAGADSEDLQAVAAALRNKNGGAANRPPEQRPLGDSAGAFDANHVEGQWKPGIDTEAHPLRTIKGVSTSSVSDLPVFIHPRAVRRSGDPEFGPSEYELLDVIGEGGVGVVYSARQSSIDRSVAVKMIKSSQQDNQSTRDKFLAEAIVTGDLDHPNIVPVYDLGKDPSGALFYSMKRVVGTPWSAVLTRKSQAENLEILMKVADAIAFAHARGVVHRDIKPENVMLGEFGEVLVMDWGIALPMSSYRKSGGVLLSQGLGGTPAYMAPEMATGPLAKIGMASDVYLLGAVLYEIVTGNPPHRGADVMSCVLAAAKNEVAPTDKTGELLDIALRAMASKPEDRYGTVLEFQKEVRSYQSHVESVVLCERAHAQLETARQSESYDDYSRAVFAYEEAVTLWSGNEPARLGQSESRLAFARCALAKGDYDLGLSQTDPNDPAHVDVIVRLREALRDRKARELRFRLMRTLVLVFAAVTLVGGVGFTWKIYQQNEDNRALVIISNKASEKAQASAEVAKAATKDAEKQKDTAVQAKTVAIAARENATKARQMAELDQDRAEEERFFAEVGVVNERVEANAFDVARQVLESQRSSVNARLRHWEWGRLEFLANGGRAGVVRSVPPTGTFEGTFETLAVSGDQQFVVTADNTGRIVLWSAEGMQLGEFPAGHRLFAVAISQDGQLVVTAGEAENGAGALRVWRRKESQANDQKMEFAKAAELPTVPHRLISVALSPDGRRIVAGGSKDDAILWTWDASTGPKILKGHFNQVWSVAFSADGQRVATAGEDETVRIWDATTGQERQRYRGHHSPVYSVAFSHRGDQLASGDYDRRVLLWPLDDSTPLTKQLDAELEEAVKNKQANKQKNDNSLPRGTSQFLGHAGSILTVGFSSDDQHLVTGSQDNTVRIWTLPAKDQSPIVVTTSDATLRGHGGWVRAVKLLGTEAEGFVVISGAMDRAWRHWNVSRYQEVVTLPGAGSPVKRAVITPDGRAIIAAREDSTIQMWHASTAQLVKQLGEGHEFLVSQAMITPNGRELLTIAADNTLRVWNLERGVEQRVLQPVGRRGIAALSPDGRFVLTGGPEKTATWWDLESEKIVHRLNPQISQPKFAGSAGAVQPVSTTKKIPDITALAVSNDGSLLFTGDDAGVCRLWDAKSGQLWHRWSRHGRGITGAAFMPSSSTRGSEAKLLLTSSIDQTLRLWDVSQDPPEEKASMLHLNPVWSFAVSPDGRQAVTSSDLPGRTANEKIRGLWLWDMSTRQAISKLDIEQAVSRKVWTNTLTWSAEEPESLLVSITDQATARQELWQWRPARKTFEPAKLPAKTRGSLWTALPINGGRQLITAGGKGARLWDTVQSRELMSFKPQVNVNALDVSRDGRWLVTAGGDGSNGIAKLWSLPEALDDSQHVQTVLGEPGRFFTAVAFSPDNEELVTGTGTGELHRWRVSDGKRASGREFPRVPSPVQDLRFSPDGRHLVAVSDDAIARVFDVSTGEVRELTGHAGPIRCAAISADSRWLITGSDDRTAIIWDLVALRQVAALVGHSAAIDAVAFSPDALRALTGSRDATAKLWNLFPVARGDSDKIEEVLTLPPHDREVTAVAFAPDGQDILTASADSSVKIWPGVAIPPAVELAPGGIEYRAGSTPMIIDEKGVVSCPSLIAGERLQLELKLVNAEAGDVLSLVTGDAHFEVRDDQVWLRPAGMEEPVAIATIESATPGIELKLTFAPNTAASLVQATLRCVAFANPNPATRPTERRVTCRLTSSRPKNPTGRVESAPPPEQRTIRVTSPQE